MNSFDPSTHIKTVTVVGVGGTGAQVARIVGRIAYDMQRSRQHAPQIVLIDPDTIEEKNVGRQLFSPSLLGKNKAECVGRVVRVQNAYSGRGRPPEKYELIDPDSVTPVT